MVKSNQKGFSTVEALLVFVVVALVIGLGCYVFSQKQQDSLETKQSVMAPVVKEKSSKITTLKEPIDIYVLDDVNKLPKAIPASFKDYLKEEIRGISKDEKCISAYSVSEISDINILGAVGAVDPKSRESTDYCFGGAKAVWYLQGNIWDVEFFQGILNCEDLNKTTIYSEFVDVCYDDSATNDTGPNPNGSIEDAH